MLIFSIIICVTVLTIFIVGMLIIRKIPMDIFVGLLIVFIISLGCIKTALEAKYIEHYTQYTVSFIHPDNYLITKKTCKRKAYNFATCSVTSSKTIPGKDLDLFYKTVGE